MASLYFDILKQAAAIAWRHKYLWLFGIFAAVVGGTIETQLIYTSFGEPNNFWLNWKQFLAAGSANGISWSVLANLRQALWSFPGSIFLLILIAAVIALLYLAFLAAASMAQTALVNNAAVIIKNQTAAADTVKPGLALGFLAGKQYFWPVFFLNAGFKFLAGVIFYIVSATFLLAYHQSLVLYLGGGALFIVLAAGLALTAMLERYAIGFLVLEKQKLWPALVSAGKLFFANWLVSVEMSFGLFFTELIGNLAVMLAVVGTTIPVLFVLNLFLVHQ